MSENFTSNTAESLSQCLSNLRQALLQVVTHEDISEETKLFLANLVKEIIVKAEDGESRSDIRQ